MQNIVIAKTYRFVPPRFSPFWARVIQWYLPHYLRKNFGITSWECVGTEGLVSSLKAGSGVMLASNHCRPCDPMVLGLLARQVSRSFHVMASWHLFMQNRVQSFLLPRIGGFSVYREGLDRESLKCATRILAEGRFPLAIFPEGFVTRNNDRLLHLMDGVAFLARSAAKQRAASPVPGKVVVHPVFVRYFFEGDLTATLTPVLQEIEARLAWQPQSHLPLCDRIVKAGHALLALKEIEYFGVAQSGRTQERLARLLDHLLEPREREWTGGCKETDSMTRIKRLRTAIVPDIIQGELDEPERARRWRQLADLYVAQQLHCYSGDYLADAPTPERLLETVERYEEDLTDRARPHPPMHAVISVGAAIEATPTRDRSADSDPIANELRRQLELMLEASKVRRLYLILNTMKPILAVLNWPAIGLRAGVVAGALVAWFWTQSLIARKSAPKEGMGDAVHDLTARWHRYFSTHHHAANAALITSSIFIDCIGFSLIGAAIFGRTFAPFLAILIVFGLRQICQGLCTLPAPPGIIWRNPGFPALLVTYEVGNDFFFSGHTALAVLGAMEAVYLGPPWLAVLAASIALGEMLIVLVLRAHYTLDVVAGALAAFLAAEVAGKLAPVVDAWLR